MNRKKSKRPTISDVAEKAGVSIATVSRVLNQNIPVADNTRKNVIKAIKDLHYRPVFAAQNLARSTTNTIGLILPQISGDYFPSILKGIEAALKEYGYRLLVYSTQYEHESSYDEILQFGDHITDGLIIFTNALDDKALHQYYEAQLPLVLLFQKPPGGLAIPEVGIKNETGAYQIVEHLIKIHECEKIVFIKGPINNSDSKWREIGYKKALADNHIEAVSERIIRGDYNMDTARKNVAKFIDREIAFDAIFSADDESAIGAIQALDSKGIRVPEEVAVVGFDDIYLAKFINPPLTTVSVPLEMVGKRAVKQIIKVIHGEEVQRLVLLPTKPVYRRSCGCE